MKLFKRVGAKFQEVARQDFSDEHFERHLEDLIEQNPNLLGDLLIIGRQVKTGRAERIDLLALDREGDVVIVELKRGTAHRDIVSQINSYLTTARKWRYDDLERIAGEGASISVERVLAKKFQQHFKCDRLPACFNSQQKGIIVAEEIDQVTIEDLNNLRSPVTAVEFSHFPGTSGDEYLLLSVKLGPQSNGQPVAPQPGRHDPVGGEKTKLREYDGFLLQVADQARKLLPDGLNGFKVTSGYWPNKQNKRFHWGGTDIHVGVIIERRKDGDTLWVYFCDYKGDQRITAILTDNKDLLKKELSLDDSELNLDDPKDAIDQFLGKVTAGGAAALVEPASERVAKYLHILKPMLGELL
jgi:hypothetical protein